MLDLKKKARARGKYSKNRFGILFTRQQRRNKDKNNNGKCAISNTDDIVQTKMRHRSIQSHNLQLFWAIYA